MLPSTLVWPAVSPSGCQLTEVILISCCGQRVLACNADHSGMELLLRWWDWSPQSGQGCSDRAWESHLLGVHSALPHQVQSKTHHRQTGRQAPWPLAKDVSHFLSGYHPSTHLSIHPSTCPSTLPSTPPPTIIHSLIHPPIRPHCEVRLAFQPKTCCLRARKEHTIRSRTRHLVLRHLAPLGFLVVPTLFLRDASLAHIPCPHSSCPTGSVPALSSLPGHRSGSTGTGRGDEEPRGALWLHPPAPQWGGSKQMHEALHRTLLSHLTLFHFFFYKTPP